MTLTPPNKDTRAGWRARWRDPDTKKQVGVTLPDYLETDEQRGKWARDKSNELARRREALVDGAPRATGTTVEQAVADFFGKKRKKPLRPKTVESYRITTAKLIRWAAENRIKSTDDIRKAQLFKLRDWIEGETKSVPQKGGSRGARVVTIEPKSDFSINRDLRSLRIVLGHLYDRGLLPKVREELELKKAFKMLTAEVDPPTFLEPAELRTLFGSALAHDAATFSETRAEHEGSKRKGTTPRYEPIAPLAAVILMSGMRLGEAVNLEWSRVDLAKGGIHLRAAHTKTKKARTIDLSVSPALRSILLALRGPESSPKLGRVFSVTESGAKSTAERLRRDFGAPATFTWQALRRTCSTFLCCAPGIFGAASAYRSARQLGHSVLVAEKHYAGVVTDIPPEVKTLEGAMQIEAELAKVGERLTSPAGSPI